MCSTCTSTSPRVCTTSSLGSLSATDWCPPCSPWCRTRGAGSQTKFQVASTVTLISQSILKNRMLSSAGSASGGSSQRKESLTHLTFNPGGSATQLAPPYLGNKSRRVPVRTLLCVKAASSPKPQGLKLKAILSYHTTINQAFDWKTGWCFQALQLLV